MHPETARLIALAEAKAERTIAIVRIVVALALGVVIAVQLDLPSAGLPALWQQRVMLAIGMLGGYLLLGVISFRIASGPVYRSWMSWLFALLDVAFIVLNLRHGLTDLDLPPAFVASFPAILLAPLVLSFGTLRYNPALQVFVTLALGAGLFAVFFRAPPPMDMGWNMTGRMRGDSMQPFSMLFGESLNVVRLVILALLAAVLILAAVRARTLLRRAVDDARRRSAVTRYLPKAIAAWLADTSVDELRGGRRQPVAVLFADIRDFTRRSEAMSAAELTAFVTAFRHRVARVVDDYGGVIDKFIGDAAMVVFGVPDPAPEDARRALSCARAIVAEMARWSDTLENAGDPPVEVGIGVHYGEVFCGAVGDESRLEFTVLGDPVNVASRLEKEAKQTGCVLLVSEALMDAARLEGEQEEGWIALPDHGLRGHDRPISLFGLPRHLTL